VRLEPYIARGVDTFDSRIELAASALDFELFDSVSEFSLSETLGEV